MPKDVIEYIVKFLVEKPDVVRISERSEGSKTFLEIHVDKNDRGRVIGKGGSAIRSIRSVASLLSPGRTFFVDVAG